MAIYNEGKMDKNLIRFLIMLIFLTTFIRADLTTDNLMSVVNPSTSTPDVIRSTNQSGQGWIFDNVTVDKFFGNISGTTGEHWWNETDLESSDFKTTKNVSAGNLHSKGNATIEDDLTVGDKGTFGNLDVDFININGDTIFTSIVDLNFVTNSDFRFGGGDIIHTNGIYFNSMNPTAINAIFVDGFSEPYTGGASTTIANFLRTYGTNSFTSADVETGINTELVFDGQITNQNPSGGTIRAHKTLIDFNPVWLNNAGASGVSLIGNEIFIDDDGTWAGDSDSIAKTTKVLKLQADDDSSFTFGGGSLVTILLDIDGDITPSGATLSNQVVRAISIDLVGNAVGISVGTGLFIAGVSGFDTNYDIFLDGSATNSIIRDGDNKKSCAGEVQDACDYYDGTDWIFNPKEVGSGKLKVLGSANITGDINVEHNFTGNQIYGEANVHPDGNITVVINTQDVHENITGFNINKTNGFIMQGNDTLIAQVSGRYQADYWLSTAGGVNRIYESCLAVNNEHVEPHAHRRQGTPGDIGSMSGGSIIDVVAGDTINLQIRNVDGTQDVDVFFAGMRLIRLGD